MFIGSLIHANATTWSRVAETVRTMDKGPWHSAWVPDHFFSPLAFLDDEEEGDLLETPGWALVGMSLDGADAGSNPLMPIPRVANPKEKK